MNLPKEFTERMRRILGEEYGAFEKSYEEVRKYGLRVNTAKLTPEEFERISPFHLTPIPWISGGYYYLEEDAPARHPFYHAGLYYLQEPTAMTPASILPVEPGERVLDICAAPGGKSTALGAKLRGKGQLVSNDISASRAKALLKNIEVFGIPNSFVANAVPARMAEQFAEYFDKVLVDAPCSGEGMFRKDVDTIRAWYPEKPAECAKIQKEIIVRAADMLRPGGMMLYSTCTFAPEENEEVIRYLMEERPQMHLTEIPYREGFSHGLNGLEQCVRLWPHKMGGEGHFMAMLIKDEASFGSHHFTDIRLELHTSDPNGTGEIFEENRSANDRNKKGKKEKRDRKGSRMQERVDQKKGSSVPDRSQMEILESFFSQGDGSFLLENIEVRNGQAYRLTGMLPPVTGIPFLRNGLYLGEIKSNRFEPSQSLALALTPGAFGAITNLTRDDERVMRYLRGETIELSEEEYHGKDGWRLVCIEGYPLGWGKLVQGLLKNKYHAGWRTKY